MELRGTGSMRSSTGLTPVMMSLRYMTLPPVTAESCSTPALTQTTEILLWIQPQGITDTTLSPDLVFTNFILNRWLYWTDYYSTVPKIQRVSMDGTGKTILHDTSLTAPYGLTLDYDTQTLYWTDYTLNKIEKSNADGSNRALVTTSMVNDAYSITFFDGRLYWTDFSYNRILTTPVNSPRSAYLSSSLNDMYGITAITEDRQPIGKCRIM